MKDFLIAIVILLILVSAFGTIESRVELGYPFGNWAVPGNTGQPVPGDGEPGAVNVFSFGSAEQTEATGAQEPSPITVTVVTEQPQMQRRHSNALCWVLFGLSAAICGGVYAFAACAYAQYFKEKRRNTLEENLYQPRPLGKRPGRCGF